MHFKYYMKQLDAAWWKQVGARHSSDDALMLGRALGFVLCCGALVSVLCCGALGFVLCCGALVSVLCCGALGFVLCCGALVSVLCCGALVSVLCCGALVSVLCCGALRVLSRPSSPPLFPRNLPSSRPPRRGLLGQESLPQPLLLTLPRRVLCGGAQRVH